MKILITGAGGYLGRGLVIPFEGRHALRVMDVKPFDSPHEVFVGDVADLDTCRKALAGMEAVVIAHMASRQAGAYETPTVAFDANVKGTAHLFFAAVELGIKRVCVISSSGVLIGHGRGRWLTATRHIPPKGNDLYTLTKTCQEVIAEQYQRVHGLSVSALRVGWVMDADTMVDKYGKTIPWYCPGLTDRRDIGLAARLALEIVDGAYEIFYVESTPESGGHCDIAYTKQRLGWAPQYDFKWLPTPEEYNRREEEKKRAAAAAPALADNVPPGRARPASLTR